ncbi:protein SPT2 homolog isoform X2 [Salvia splendens]|uniref:protein SPT2 homolog isoform X2 n=1 Tax=Salvia splendens TaxID=180675 RepID=UPI001C266A04|nr:protein SPT2 homolog isoform X2 [Salvia splendens]
MGGYEKDEYENWDEYEEDGEEQEEEDVDDDGYERVHKPTQEELDYLALRQRLKESIRKQMKKDTGTANPGSRDKVNSSRRDNYGSFFGPSQPVIAQRVIQESKSLLENPDLAASICRTSHKEKKSSVTAPVSSKSQTNRPLSVKTLKKKVEILKNTRDYSFLLSDDAEVPASSKVPPPRKVSAPKSDARSAELMQRSRPMGNGRAKEVFNGPDGRKPMLPCSQSKSKVGMDKSAHTNKSSTESRKQFGNNNGSGPGRPLGPKVLPSYNSVRATAKSAQPAAKKNISVVRKPTSSPLQPVARRPVQLNPQSGNNRPTSLHGQPSALRRPVQNDNYESSKPKVASRQSLPSSKVQLKRSPQSHPKLGPLRNERPKAKPKRQFPDDDSEGEQAINMIRQMFGYNPNKFRDDDDTGDMEANFDDILMEEKRSARIARQEDEEQLRLIEEEERRDRIWQAKKRKMSH